MTVYTKKHFKVYRVGDGYVLHNTNKPFQNGHTHLKSLGYARTIIDNVLFNRTPDTKNRYLITSHMRVAEDSRYIQLLYELSEARCKRKLSYNNKQKGRSADRRKNQYK